MSGRWSAWDEEIEDNNDPVFLQNRIADLEAKLMELAIELAEAKLAEARTSSINLEIKQELARRMFEAEAKEYKRHQADAVIADIDAMADKYTQFIAEYRKGKG